MADVDVVTKKGALFGSDALANAIVIVTPARSAVYSVMEKKLQKTFHIFSRKKFDHIAITYKYDGSKTENHRSAESKPNHPLLDILLLSLGTVDRP
jgi:hypothetical protein